MFGIIKLYKNQIANEMRINRHIAAQNKVDGVNEATEIDYRCVKSRLVGLKRSTWVSLLFMVISTSGLILMDFWMQKTMFSILLLLFITAIYTNSHNIENHLRWIRGQNLLNKNQYASLFLKKPMVCIKQSFTDRVWDHENT